MTGSYGFDRNKVWGWVIPEDGSKFVEIILNGRVAGCAPINIFRSDVAASALNKQVETGFEFALQSDLADSIEVRTQKKRVYLNRAEGTALVGPPPEMKSSIGIGVVTYNRLEYLQNVLKRIASYTTVPYYLVIADDGSDDGTAEWCKTNGIPIVSGKNRGVAWNKNRALFHLMERTDAEIIIIVEDDCWPTDKFWVQMWGRCTQEYHHINYAHPGISDNVKIPVLKGRGTYRDPYLSSLLAGVCTASTRLSLKSVGYLDARFKGYGAEHVEWSIRFNKAYPIDYEGSNRTNLFYQIRCGMEEHDAPSYRNEEQIAINRATKLAIADEPIYRNPWHTEEEKSLFLKEQESVKSKVFLSNATMPSFNLSEMLVLLHVPKTAGTSLRIGLESIFDRSSIAYDYGPTERLTSNFIKENPQNILQVAKVLEEEKVRLLVGHFNIDKYLPVLKAEQFIMFFRDPVERVISDYKHFVRLHGYKDSLMTFAAGEQFRNRQSKFLKGVGLDQLGFVGISECYEESIKRLNEKYNLEIPIVVVNNDRKNIEEKHFITDEERVQIERLNQEDRRIYNAAIRLFRIRGNRVLEKARIDENGLAEKSCSDSIELYEAEPVKIQTVLTELEGKLNHERSRSAREDIAKPQKHITINNKQNFQASDANLKGLVDNIRMKTVAGWVFSEESKIPLEVECHVNGRVVDRVLANRFRNDLKNKKMHPDGLCGFRFDLKDEKITAETNVEVFVVGYMEKPLKLATNAKAGFHEKHGEDKK